MQVKSADTPAKCAGNGRRYEFKTKVKIKTESRRDAGAT